MSKVVNIGGIKGRYCYLGGTRGTIGLKDYNNLPKLKLASEDIGYNLQQALTIDVFNDNNTNVYVSLEGWCEDSSGNNIDIDYISTDVEPYDGIFLTFEEITYGEIWETVSAFSIDVQLIWTGWADSDKVLIEL